jgi:hypothetical protein
MDSNEHAILEQPEKEPEVALLLFTGCQQDFLDARHHASLERARSVQARVVTVQGLESWEEGLAKSSEGRALAFGQNARSCRFVVDGILTGETCNRRGNLRCDSPAGAPLDERHLAQLATVTSS